MIQTPLSVRGLRVDYEDTTAVHAVDLEIEPGMIYGLIGPNGAGKTSIIRSIAALVEAFQEKEERDRMILMAEMQNKLVEDEANRLETMDEYKARILGISKKELL